MKKNSAAPARQRVQTAETAPEYGLTLAQVEERTAAGLANLPVEPPTRTVGQIVLSNVFTYFNMLFVLLAVCVVLVRSWLDLTFLGVVFFNTAGGDPNVLMGPMGDTLAAISAGAVFMGANTYIGNAPNFMVRSIAEEQGVPMPSFFGYMAWSCCFLLPIFALLTFLFFV